MKKRYSFRKLRTRAHYFINQPIHLSDLTYEELDDDTDYYGWREKARRLQARRWRKIKHQLV